MWSKHVLVGFVVACAVGSSSFSFAESAATRQNRFVDKTGKVLVATVDAATADKKVQGLLKKEAAAQGLDWDALSQFDRYKLLPKLVKEGALDFDQMYWTWGEAALLRAINPSELAPESKVIYKDGIALAKEVMRLISEKLSLPDPYWNYDEDKDQLVTQGGKIIVFDRGQPVVGKETEDLIRGYFERNKLEIDAKRISTVYLEKVTQFVAEEGDSLSLEQLWGMYAMSVLVEADAADVDEGLRKAARELERMTVAAIDLHPVFWLYNRGKPQE